ncbi:MAG: cytochrome c biogenesis CcdA family protein [Propionibacteriaceae bacterium]
MILLESWFAEAISGSLLLAAPIAVFAGIVSFFSPCVLPLLPAYLSYASGLSAADILAGDTKQQRGRMLLGTSLFVLGFAVVFVLTGAFFGGIGAWLVAHSRIVEIVAGILCLILGLIFADLISLGQRNIRPARIASVGVAAAFPLGAAFGIGWTPCIGPTLSVVLTLALNEGSAGRGSFLAFCYAAGLGVPFIVAAVAFHRMGRTVKWVRRHQRAIQRGGGGLMMVIGVLMISSMWHVVVTGMQALIAAWGVPI